MRGVTVEANGGLLFVIQCLEKYQRAVGLNVSFLTREDHFLLLLSPLPRSFTQLFYLKVNKFILCWLYSIARLFWNNAFYNGRIRQDLAREADIHSG